MRSLAPLLAAASAAALLALAPAAALAQPDGYNAAAHDHWTLKERQHWLYDRLHKAKDDGSINGHEYDRVHDRLDAIQHEEDRLRDHQDGELTSDQMQTFEARLDEVADHIQWLHENAFQKPWG